MEKKRAGLDAFFKAQKMTDDELLKELEKSKTYLNSSFINAVRMLDTAFSDLVKTWDAKHDDSDACDAYPFHMSLDELAVQVAAWRQAVDAVGYGSRFYVNVKPDHDEYLFVLRQEDGRPLYDELGRGSCETELSDCIEITESQYNAILEQHENGGDGFDGDWDAYESYIWAVIGNVGL